MPHHWDGSVRGPRRLRSFTPAPARMWNYLDCTKREGAEGGRGLSASGGKRRAAPTRDLGLVTDSVFLSVKVGR